MTRFLKITLIPTLLAGLTLFSITATDLSRKNPSPVAMLGAPFEHTGAPFPSDGLSFPMRLI
jgi:hypothetical protein